MGLVVRGVDDTGPPAERAMKSFFYPNHDWALPVGYVFHSPADNFLYTAFWVRGNTNNVQPHVFYKGQDSSPGASPSRRSVA